MASALIRNSGRPDGSSAYGISEPKGYPAWRREAVESTPVRPWSTSVRARSAYEGSGASCAAGRGRRVRVSAHAAITELARAPPRHLVEKTAAAPG